MIAGGERPWSHPPGRSLRWLAGRSLGTTATAVLENKLPVDGFVPAHSHSVEELLFCGSGCGEAWIDGQAYAFAGGDTIVVPAGYIHSFCNLGTVRLWVLAFFPCAEPDVRWLEPQYQDNWTPGNNNTERS